MPDLVLRRVALRRVLALPRPLLRLACGGGAMIQGGRTLDARLQFLACRAKMRPPISSLTPSEARLAVAETERMLDGPVEPGVAIETLTLASEIGPIPARAYRPADQDPAAPTLVFAHGGGGVVGDIASSQAFASTLAAVLRGPVLSVGYRLAPENRFPAPLDDMMAALRWTRANGGRFGAPAGRVAIGGECLGANLAAVVCQELRSRGEAQPDLQLLLYPLTDIASETPSMRLYADAWPLGRATLDWFMGHYLGPGDSPADPRLSPLKAPDLTGLAPAVIATAGFDPLVDQGEAYARALEGAGVPVVYRCYDNLAHGFAAFTGVMGRTARDAAVGAPTASAACHEIATLARGLIEGRPA